MKRSRRQGLTLIELTISIAVLSLIAAAAAALLSVCLQAQAYGMARSGLQREGALAMERMVSQIRVTSRIAIPNGQQPLRDQLALAEGLNNDGDFYFDDPLFPRIDEDSDDDNNGDGGSGIKGYDDDGDGVIDEDAAEDNDEDGGSGEDKADGLDDDGDGMVDEDTPGDANADGASGLAGADEDGDGEIDEGDVEDDDPAWLAGVGPLQRRPHRGAHAARGEHARRGEQVAREVAPGDDLLAGAREGELVTPQRRRIVLPGGVLVDGHVTSSPSPKGSSCHRVASEVPMTSMGPNV